MRTFLLTALLGGAIGIGSAAAAVIVKVGPPRPVVEERTVAPGPGYIWVGGYHTWNGTAYVWTPGSWVRPPHPHAVWVAPRWVHRHGGYEFVEGRWR